MGTALLLLSRSPIWTIFSVRNSPALYSLRNKPRTKHGPLLSGGPYLGPPPKGGGLSREDLYRGTRSNLGRGRTAPLPLSPYGGGDERYRAAERSLGESRLSGPVKVPVRRLAAAKLWHPAAGCRLDRLCKRACASAKRLGLAAYLHTGSRSPSLVCSWSSAPSCDWWRRKRATSLGYRFGESPERWAFWPRVTQWPLSDLGGTAAFFGCEDFRPHRSARLDATRSVPIAVRRRRSGCSGRPPAGPPARGMRGPPRSAKWVGSDDVMISKRAYG